MNFWIKSVSAIKYWTQLLMLPIYCLSFITPRSKNIWLFGSTFGRRFADNPRYFFLYMNQFKNDEIRSIWISKNKKVVKFIRSHGYEAYYSKSIKGIFYCLRAKKYIFDNYSKDICFWLSGGAQKINLWHGTATKKITQDNKFDYNRHPRNLKERLSTWLIRISNEKPSHYVLSTSSKMEPIMKSAFAVKEGHVLSIGHPRNDVLMRNDLKDIYTIQESTTRKKLEDLHNSYKKIIFYVPTFRESEGAFFDIVNLDSFNSFLKANNYVLATKLHIKSKLKKKFEMLSYSNIININADVDPATILSYCDFMIADYSSIYLDYMFLERPAVSFPFDYEEYVTKSRECYFDYDDYMPEIKVYTQKDLEKSIIDIFLEDQKFLARKTRRSYHFDYIDGNSSERLYKMLINI